MATPDKKRPSSSTAPPNVSAENSGSAMVGIPRAVFVPDIGKFMKEPGNTSAEVVLRRFDENYRKYKFMEANLSVKKSRLLRQISDIKQSMEMVEYLEASQKSAEAVRSHFILSDGVYAEANIPPTNSVMLWLGANVMLEYPIDEALTLLRNNLTAAETSLKTVNSDLDTIKDQMTTLEVQMARVYNWDVQDRKKTTPGSS